MEFVEQKFKRDISSYDDAYKYSEFALGKRMPERTYGVAIRATVSLLCNNDEETRDD